MTDTLPPSNLPDESQPWRRAIERLLHELLRNEGRTRQTIKNVSSAQATTGATLGQQLRAAAEHATNLDRVLEQVTHHNEILTPAVQPSQVTGLRVASQTATFSAETGAAITEVTLAWDWVAVGTDGSPLSVDGYEVQITDQGNTSILPLVLPATLTPTPQDPPPADNLPEIPTPDDDLPVGPPVSEDPPVDLPAPPLETRFTVPSGRTVTVTVRALLGAMTFSDPSEPLTIIAIAPPTFSSPPSEPSLTAGPHVVAISWDGKLADGSTPGAGIQHVYAETAASAAGPWTRAAGVPARTPAQVATVRAAPGSTVHARLLWADTLGRTSPPSPSASVVVPAVVREDIDESITSAIDEATASASAAGVAAEQAVADALTAQETAAAAQGAALTATEAAASAAGIAGGKADVLIQPTAPAAAMRKATTLWIDTTGGTNKPKRWAGSDWVAVTDKTATDAAAAAANAASAATAASSQAAAAQGAADQAAAAASAAQSTANQAAAAASSAQSAAASAVSSASGRNAMYHATTAPSGSGTRNGDLWHQWSAMSTNGRLLGVWVWNDTEWQKRALDESYLPLVNIGSGTYGSLRGDRFEANSIAASRLVLGDFTNLVEDPYFDLRSATSWEGGGGQFVEDAWEGRRYSLRFAGSGERRQSPIPVKAGDQFRFACFYKASGWPTSGGSGGLRLQKSTDGGVTYTDLASTNFANSATWREEAVTVTVPAGVTHIRVRVAFAAPGATITMNGFSLRRMSGGELLVDGAVGAREINTSSLWANEAFLEAATVGVLRAGVIEVDMLAPGFGQNIDLTANGAVNIVITQQAQLASDLSRAQSDIADAASAASVATEEAGRAQAGAEAAAEGLNELRGQQEDTQAQLAEVQTAFWVDSAGAHVGRSDSSFQAHVLADRFQITDGGVVQTYWSAGVMNVPSAVVTEMVLANHMIQNYGDGTVVRAA